ncbi:hypothetical protein BDV12DRAFT_22722 [Aspergillus spectabilis]
MDITKETRKSYFVAIMTHYYFILSQRANCFSQSSLNIIHTRMMALDPNGAESNASTTTSELFFSPRREQYLQTYPFAVEDPCTYREVMSIATINRDLARISTDDGLVRPRLVCSRVVSAYYACQRSLKNGAKASLMNISGWQKA